MNTFQGSTGGEWLIWRKQFEIAVDIARWDDQRACQELFTAMGEKAAPMVADLRIHGRSILDLLDMYESRFVTQAQTHLAKTEYQIARQTDDESVLEWHCRLRNLYHCAHPGMRENSPGLGEDLRERFIRGLKDVSVCEYTWERAPVNYAAALALAQTKVAINLKVEAREEKGATGMHALEEPPAHKEVPQPPPTGPTSPEHSLLALGGTRQEVAAHCAPLLAAFRRMGGPNGSCHICSKMGHMKKDCPIWTSMLRYFKKAGLLDPEVLADIFQRAPPAPINQQSPPNNSSQEDDRFRYAQAVQAVGNHPWIDGPSDSEDEGEPGNETG